MKKILCFGFAVMLFTGLIVSSSIAFDELKQDSTVEVTKQFPEATYEPGPSDALIMVEPAEMVTVGEAVVNPPTDDVIERKHPGLGDAGGGYLVRAYDYLNDATLESDVMWQGSIDNGLTWSDEFHFLGIDGFPQYPSVDYWGITDTLEYAWYGTFVCPPEMGNGRYIYLMKAIGDPSNPLSYTLTYYNTLSTFYDMKSADIATDIGYSSSDLTFGAISAVLYSDYAQGYVPFTYWVDQIGLSHGIFSPNFDGIETISSCIDHQAYYLFEAFDWYSQTAEQWKLGIGRIHWYAMTQGDPSPSSVWSAVALAGFQIRHPVVAAENAKVVILAEVYDSSYPDDTDILCWWTTTGNITSLTQSTVVATTDRESSPEVTHISGTTFKATFVKNGVLYITTTTDTGATWSTPEPVSGTDVVVDEYRTADLSERASKAIWEYEAGTGIIDINWCSLFPDVWITLTPTGITTFPPLGGVLEYSIAVGNNEPEAQIVDIWVDVTLPNGATYGPVVGPVNNFTFPAGFSTSRDRTLTIPAGAPTGTYSLNGFLGEYSASDPIVYSEDHFDFEKTP